MGGQLARGLGERFFSISSLGGATLLEGLSAAGAVMELDVEEKEEIVAAADAAASCSAARRISLCESRDDPVRPSQLKRSPYEAPVRSIRSSTLTALGPNLRRKESLLSYARTPLAKSNGGKSCHT